MPLLDIDNIDVFPYITSFFFIYVIFKYTPFYDFIKREAIDYHERSEAYVKRFISSMSYLKFITNSNLDSETKSDLFGEEKEELKEEPITDLKEAVIEIKYEDKYLDKYAAFPNNYAFTEEEMLIESVEYKKSIHTWEVNLRADISDLEYELAELDPIFEAGIIKITDEVIQKMICYFNIEDSYADEPGEYDVEELFNDLKARRYQLSAKLDELLINCEIPDFVALANEKTINNRLDKYVNNYILEQTPLGNVYMRYNNSKKSFEYFSNSTIPYRYLETIGRKYVMTFWCKPLFIDLVEELKRAEEKKNLEEKENDTKPDIKVVTKKTNIKPSFSSRQHMMSGTNKSNANTSNSTSNNTSTNASEKGKNAVILKENANRYTWEGRLSNLPLLKKPPKKSETLSFAEFKLLQQQQKMK
jgi:hypothetical protein